MVMIKSGGCLETKTTKNFLFRSMRISSGFLLVPVSPFKSLCSRGKYRYLKFHMAGGGRQKLSENKPRSLDMVLKL